MKNLLTGAFIASIAVIALHLYGEKLLGRILARGDANVWGDACKQPTYKQMTGRLPNE